MIAQIININSEFVFEKYNKKYKIFKDLKNKGYFGIEIRNANPDLAGELHQHILKNETFSYFFKTQNGIDLFILGTFEKILELISGVKSNVTENLGHQIANLIHNYLTYNEIKVLNQSNKSSLIMGILNITPDSFSDGGKYFKKEDALIHIEEMISEGADIIDIGAESTRPFSESITEEEEIERLLPVLDSLDKFSNVIFSIDTTKSAVAEEALKRGVKIVNDISGLTRDLRMIDIVSKYNATCVIMHSKGNPKEMQINPVYEDVVNEIYEFLYFQVKKLKEKGIDKIIIDPGIGFGKSLSHNFEIINRLEEFKGIGCPILIGLSRKSLIGKSLNLEIEYRDVPTAILETISLSKGAKIVRTHNVQNAFYERKLFEFVNNPYQNL